MKHLTLKTAALLAMLTTASSYATTIDVGSLPSDATPVDYVGDIGSGELDRYTFSIGEDITADNGAFLNIQTFGEDGFDLMDTMIGLYDGDGNLIASDDDDNADGAFSILYSLLSFGTDDPLGNTIDSAAGQDGLLSAGDYTVIVGGYHTNFTQHIDDVTGGTSVGDYNLLLTFGGATIQVSAPAQLSLFGFSLLALGYSRKRQAR